MNVYERIKMLCSKKRMSVAELERKLNLSNGSISKWAKSKPNSDQISRIAEFFDVSVDYLLGRTNNPKTADNFVDESEEMAMLLFRKSTENMTEKQKKKFTSSLSNLMEAARDIVEDDDNFK